MHKFFCFYNNLTQRFELSQKQSFRNSTILQAENTLIPEIKNNIQLLYENIVLLKEQEKEEERLEIFDETELYVSNLFYSLFSSPLELVEDEKIEPNLQNAINTTNNLIRDINIPEHNRLCQLIKNNLERLI